MCRNDNDPCPAGVLWHSRIFLKMVESEYWYTDWRFEPSHTSPPSHTHAHTHTGALTVWAKDVDWEGEQVQKVLASLRGLDD
jgi:hypothetical protein